MGALAPPRKETEADEPRRRDTLSDTKTVNGLDGRTLGAEERAT